MANDKKPSIYSDRSSIGSAEELDEYGVWVKSEPQVLSGSGKSSDLEDLALPVEDSSDMDDSLSFDDAVIDLGGKAETLNTDDFQFPDDDINVDLDTDPLASPSDLADFNMPEDDNLGIADDSATPVQDEEIEIEDTSFDEFEMPAGESDIKLDDDIIGDTGEEFADEELIIDDISSEDLSMDNVTSEEFSTNDLDIPGDDTSADDLNLTIDDLSTDDLSIPDDDLNLTADDSDIPGSDSASDDITMSDDGLADDNFINEDFDIPTVKSIENSVDSIQSSFDDAQSGSGELSSHLLKKIADELSSIRSELTDLKREFASVRPSMKEGEKEDRSGFFSGEEDETIALTGDEFNEILGEGGEPAEAGAGEAASSGFDIGGDDEDEAIALTGDEMENILNSADFTEESGTEESPESAFSLDDDSLDISVAGDDSLGISITDDSLDIVSPSDDSLVMSIADDSMDLDSIGDIPEIAEESSEETPSDEAPSEEISLDDIDAGSISIEDEFAGIDAGSVDSDTDSIELDADSIILDTDSIDIDIDTDSIELDADSIVLDTDPIEFDTSAIDIDSASFDEDVSIADAGVDTAEEAAVEEPAAEETSADETIELDAGDLDIDLSADLAGDEGSIDIPAIEEEAVIEDSEPLPLADLSDEAFADFTGGAGETADDAELDELEKLREDGAMPVNFAPDNSSYLEEDIDIDIDIDAGGIDLSDAVIDEPELSTDDIAANDELTEPSLDESSFDLDALNDLTIDEAPAEDLAIEEAPLADDSAEETGSFDTGSIEAEPAALDDMEDISVTDGDQGISMDLDDDDWEQPVMDPNWKAPTQEALAAPVPAHIAAPVQAAPQAAPSPAPAAPQIMSIPQAASAAPQNGFEIPSDLRSELRNILSYMDQLLESLPETKIEEFAKSEYFDSYKKLFKELGLV